MDRQKWREASSDRRTWSLARSHTRRACLLLLLRRELLPFPLGVPLATTSLHAALISPLPPSIHKTTESAMRHVAFMVAAGVALLPTAEGFLLPKVPAVTSLARLGKTRPSSR